MRCVGVPPLVQVPPLTARVGLAAIGHFLLPRLAAFYRVGAFAVAAIKTSTQRNLLTFLEHVRVNPTTIGLARGMWGGREHKQTLALFLSRLELVEKLAGHINRTYLIRLGGVFRLGLCSHTDSGEAVINIGPEKVRHLPIMKAGTEKQFKQQTLIIVTGFEESHYLFICVDLNLLLGSLRPVAPF